MAKDEKSDNLSTVCTLAAVFLIACTCYWQCAPWLAENGIEFRELNKFLYEFRSMLSSHWGLRGFALGLIALSSSQKIYRRANVTLPVALVWSLFGTGIMMLPTQSNPVAYLITCITGFITSAYGYTLLLRGLNKGNGDSKLTFQQTDEIKENANSVNIPYHYEHKGRRHRGWINIVNPFRGSMVLGAPGSGKSFAIINKYFEDLLRKNFSLFVYDYKFPALTEEVLTELCYQRRHEWDKKKANDRRYGEKPLQPKFYCINFDDPMRSNRCNPIHHKYIIDQADSSDIAETLFMSLNKGKKENGKDFFKMSAQMFIDALIYFLANYDPEAIYDGKKVIGSKSNGRLKGSLCTFPHIIEMMALNFEKIFQILSYTEGLEAKVSLFITAIENEAMEQIAGQVASAQLELAKFVSPTLYWVMTGDDFTLDINNPYEPKIICIGNSPLRQEIYGSALALYTMQLFKIVNQPKMLKSAIILDEFPTMFTNKPDNVINTARSNKVGMLLGAQDFTQIVRDYGKDNADVIFGTVGTKMTGQVDGDTAKKFSEIFGKRYHEKKELTINDDSDSVRVSHNLEEIVPQSTIGTLSQGEFIGRVADDVKNPIKEKLFYGNIDVDLERGKAKEKEWISMPYITDFFNGKMPQMTEEERKEITIKYPEYAKNERKIQELFIKKIINDRVDENFMKVKKDVRDLLEREYSRTKILADMDKAKDRAQK